MSTTRFTPWGAASFISSSSVKLGGLRSALVCPAASGYLSTSGGQMCEWASIQPASSGFSSAWAEDQASVVAAAEVAIIVRRVKLEKDISLGLSVRRTSRSVEMPNDDGPGGPSYNNYGLPMSRR